MRHSRKWNKIIKIILLAQHKHSFLSRKSIPISNQSRFLLLVLLVLCELSLHHLLLSSHINQWKCFASGWSFIFFFPGGVLNQVIGTLCKWLISLMSMHAWRHTHTICIYFSRIVSSEICGTNPLPSFVLPTKKEWCLHY